MQSIARAARLTGSRDSATLTPVLHELVHEAPTQLAWIRILSFDGKVLAESESPPDAPRYQAGDLGNLISNRERRPAERKTASGDVIVIVNAMRFGPPALPRAPNDPSFRIMQTPVPPAGRGGPDIAEIAVFLDGVSTNFGLLRQNLIVGCSAAFALMAAVIVIGLRFRHYMRGKHMEEELTLARRVQRDLFPSEDSLASSLQFAARCLPSYEVGGDLYDVFEMDDGRVGMVLGDVSGKGLPAALLMGVVQGAVRASSVTGAPSRHERAAERLNHLLCMKTARERFVSLFWCYFDRPASMLRYVNAGHLPPLLVRQDRDGQQKVIRLDSGGPVLGLLPGARYTQAQVQVERGDLLVVFSDGILEAANSKDEEFGEAGVLASVARNWNTSAREICGGILADVRTFLGKELPQDDQTLLVIQLDAAVQELGGATTVQTPAGVTST
jgi:hypothetical protein